MLGKTAVVEIDDRNIQPVEPDHRRFSWIAMVVKSPGRRENEIARVHGYSLAIHRGVSALAFDDETQRARRVAMAAGKFAGKHQLQAGINALRDSRATREAGIFEHQDAAFGFA